MSVENSQGRFPALHEALNPKEQVFVASANIIDQIGELRNGSQRVFYDASWEDDSSGRRFELQMHASPQPSVPTAFFLQVFQQFSHGKAIERYRYNSTLPEVQRCDDQWQKVGGSKLHGDIIPSVLQYLSSGPSLSPEDDQIFIEIMRRNKITDPRFAQKARRFAWGVIKALGSGSG
ncbi:MAG TPA: hypothetical protein PK096_00250 [Candidatus Saccharibacteria bacterium]|nr:hypothetical protein [Candidatus Saccharibacteria bacterium]HRK93786.1 hypothetical protein [Candidatus Saccharibacteria bacterium]